jgi:hypothetical protein
MADGLGDRAIGRGAAERNVEQRLPHQLIEVRALGVQR